jgi:hypothetical protein
MSIFQLQDKAKRVYFFVRNELGDIKNGWFDISYRNRREFIFLQNLYI